MHAHVPLAAPVAAEQDQNQDQQQNRNPERFVVSPAPITTLGEPAWEAFYVLVYVASAVLVEAARLAPGVAGRLGARLRRPQEPEPAPLSARETEVLAHAARGMTNGGIGRALFISEATVKTHLLRACVKLGVSGRTAAVAAATERGLLKPPAG